MATWGSIRNNALFSMNRLSAEMSRLQEMASTGKRLVRASDSPGEVYRILHLKSEERSAETYLDNLGDVMSNMDLVSSVMLDISGAVTSARTYLIQGASATLNADNRIAIGNQFDAILEQVVYAANTQSMGRYLFAGAKPTTQAYTVQRQGGKITSVTYQGSLTNLSVPVAPGVKYNGTVVGADMFIKYKRGEITFDGATGAAPGQATSNATGNVWLEVRHTTSVYNNLGIVPAANSADDDTAIGNHTLTIDLAGNMQLDGGPLTTINAGVTSQLVTNSAGDKIYIDPSGWTSAAGNVNIVSNGELTIDDGATTLAIDFSNNQKVTHGATGKILYIDSSAVDRIGHESVSIAGTHDLFNTLINIRDLMLNTRSLPESDQERLLSDSVDSLMEVAAAVSQSMATVGSRLRAMESLKTSLENLKDQRHSQAAALEDADIIQIATELAHVQNYYQLTLMATSQLLSMTLLDFL